MKVVWKYGTGHEIPDGARYLCTQVETQEVTHSQGETFKKNIYVWHYYEVEQSPSQTVTEKEK